MDEGRPNKLSRRIFLASTGHVLVGVAVSGLVGCADKEETPETVSEQPPEARANQEADFPQLIALVESLGITISSSSKLFWFQVPGDVGPVGVEAVVPRSFAEAAGLISGDMIVQIRRIPHFQRPGFLQSEEIKGGAVQLGKNIQRALTFGFTNVTLRVNRSGALIDMVLLIQ